LKKYLPKNKNFIKPIRLGMVGGGVGSFIGNVHRLSSRLDSNYDLVAGAFSSTAKKSLQSGLKLGIEKKRIYSNYKEMAKIESLREDKIEAVAIVTPNNSHSEIAIEFLKKNIHVICDKPLTATIAQAKKLASVAKKSKALLAITYNYSGYPLVHQAKKMVSNGSLGKIRFVEVKYATDYMATPVEKTKLKQAVWRTDPKQAGIGGCILDIGTHAYHLCKFITGLKAIEVSADLHTFVSGRKVDDHAQVQINLEKNAKAILWASQIAIGNENSLSIRVYGTRDSIEWCQESPNQLWFTKLNSTKQLITRMGKGSMLDLAKYSRVPAGMPEGYIEAFANIYSEIAIKINKINTTSTVFPNIEDGIDGMKFVETCIKSSNMKSKWTKLKKL